MWIFLFLLYFLLSFCMRFAATFAAVLFVRFHVFVGVLAAFDFTAFETDVLPRWLAQFRTARSDYLFAFHVGGPPALYGSADVAHVLFITNNANVSGSEAAAWAAALDTFLNASDGFYELSEAEQTPSHGFQPWHALGYATAAHRLFGSWPARTSAAVETLAATPSAWAPTMAGLLNESVACGPAPPGNVFCWCAHKAAALPAVMLMDRAPARFAPFLEWLFPFASAMLDPVRGVW
jgi:hypothetical protein